MKNLVLMTVLSVFISFSTQARNDKEKSDIKKKRVLLVSFITKNFYSTYDNAEVAEANKITEEKVLKMLDEKILSTFANSDEGIEFINYTDTSLSEKVDFRYNEKELLIPELGELTNDEFNKLLEENNVDHVIFINNYEMKWIGDPQFKLDNEIHYSIFKKNKENVVEEKYSFSTPKLVPATKMNKKYKKAVAKICTKFLKNS